jgi:hypothetical protein
MTLSLLRHAGWAGLLAACGAATACSSTTNPTADAFVSATVGAGSDPMICAFGGTPMPWLEIGDGVGGNPTRINNGGSNGDGSVDVNCTVHPDGNGFDISLSAELTGPMGASLIIQSSGSGAVTTSGGTVQASFGSGTNGSYSSNNCTITYTYNGTAVPDSPPIAAGRIWGHVDCPAAMDTSSTKTGPDGGPTSDTCDANADFLFEQCGQ